MLYKRAEEAIGNTTLCRLSNIEAAENLSAQLYGKLEFQNPTGSAKDRAAKEILDDAERKGLLKPGGVVVEATSGNTGIALASLCSQRGYHAIIILPDSMSKERILLMRAYGAEVLLSDGSKGMAGSLEKLAEVKQRYPDALEAGQFTNPANAEAHYKTTGPEILRDLPDADIFVAGIGTGGTITGTARYLKEVKPSVRIVGVEPASSPLLTKGVSGPHGLQGIGANFVPDILDLSLIDEILTVTDADAFEKTRLLGKKEGLLLGITSGAALSAAIELAKRNENKGKRIVALFPDSGDRYLSGSVFQSEE